MRRVSSRVILLGLLAAGSMPITTAVAQPAARGAAQSAVGSAGGQATLPLESGRTVSFTTSEGSWLSLDVSPDGQTIAFDLLGDLYTLPIEGGVATRITSGLAFDAQPRFSPDGTKLLFTSDRDGGENLWILDLEADGDERFEQLTRGKHFRYQSPEWTPDGDYVVASRAGLRSGSSKLFMFHIDGSGGFRIGDAPQNQKMLGAAFGDDGRYLWYARRTGNWQYNAIFPQYQLAVYDREDGQSYSRSSRLGSAFRPTLSTDGRWLVYATRHEDQTGLRLRDLSNGEERWLAYPVQHDDQESRATRDAYPGMSFTPDSTELVVSYGGGIWRIPVAGGAAIEVPFLARVQAELGPKLDFDYAIDDTAEFDVRQIRDALPSPDGTRLVFAAMGRLWLVDWPDGVPRRLTDSETMEAQPAWSPDGSRIAYVTWNERDGGHLYDVAAGGGTPNRLTTRAGIYQTPAYSPDGERIVAIRGPVRSLQEATGPFAPGANQDLVWIPAGGGDWTLVAPTNGRHHPHFAVDSERIYLTSFSDGLTSIRWDGTDSKSHLQVSAPRPPDYTGSFTPRADLILLSPDGRRALAQTGAHLFVFEVPASTGRPARLSTASQGANPVPMRRVTEIGGEFPAWSSDGSAVHWSIGNAHVRYDLAAAERVDDERAERARAERIAERAETDAGEDDSGDGADDAAADAAPPIEDYEPEEVRIRLRAARDLPTGVALLRGARVITMRGNEVIEDAELLVRGNRIVRIGASGSLHVPADARVIDVAGKTIVPGFVDTHAHMWPAWGIHREQVWAYLANLAWGVTTTRDPQTATTDVLTYSDMVRAGRMLGPRVYSTGPGVFWEEQIRDLDHAREVLARYSDYYDTKTIKMYVAGNREMRQWILMAAREQQLMPTTEGSLNLKMNLTQLLDGYPGQEHSYPVYPLYRDVVELTARAGMTYTPTLVVAYGGPWAENWFFTRENPHDDPKVRRFMPHSVVDSTSRRRGAGTGPGPGGWFMDEEHVFPEQAAVVRDVVQAGGRAGVGSHGQFQGLGYHWELWAMQAGGLSEHDALRVATIFGAEAIGLDGDLGSIAPGKLADLVVLDANPLEDIRNTNTISMVMINGRLFDAGTLDEVWPRQRPLEGLDWLETEAAPTRAGEQRP